MRRSFAGLLQRIRWLVLALIVGFAHPASADRWSQFLPLENVSHIGIQYDSLGQAYYWAGTDDNDLWQFDGQQFIHVNIPDTTEYGTVRLVTALAIDPQQAVLWVGTKDGLFRYHIKSQTWQHYDYKTGLAGNHITALYFDKKNRTLWYGTFGSGVGKINNQGRFRYTTVGLEKWLSGTEWILVSKRGLASLSVIECITQDKDGNMYLGTSDAGLCILSQADSTWNCLKDFLPAANTPAIKAIAIDRDGNKWLGTGGVSGRPNSIGVCWLDRSNHFVGCFTPANSGLADSSVYAIWIDAFLDGDLKWFATDRGVSVLDSTNQHWETFDAKSSELGSDTVRDISGDRDGNIWFGLLDLRGVSRLNNNWSELRTEDGLANDVVFQVEKDVLGRLWVGSRKGNVKILSRGQWNRLTLPNPNCEDAPAVTAFLPEDTAMWVASQCGVFKFGLANYALQCAITVDLVSGLPENDIRAIAVRGDTLWAGTFESGLARIVNCNTKPRLDKIFLPDHHIKALAFNHQGQLWVGTDRGLQVFTGIQFRAIPDFDQMPVSAITRDPAGATWVGTDNGLARFDGEGWQHFSTADGLPDNRITAIGIAPDGAVWCGTITGAASYSYQDRFWTAYTTDDGLSNNHIRDLSFGPANVVWFATFGGGVAKYRKTSITPETYLIEPFNILTEATAVFQYSGYDINTLLTDLRYQYALDDTLWSFPTSATRVKLVVNHDGPHTFHVRAIDKDGNVDHQPANFQFYKISPRQGRAMTIIDPSLGRNLDSLWLYVPPVALAEGSTISFKSVAVDTNKVVAQDKNFHFANIAFWLVPESKNTALFDRRPVTMTIFYNENNIMARKFDARKLAIYRYEGKWLLHGGTADLKRRTITTTITQLDTFALLVNLSDDTPPKGEIAFGNLAAQPRMLSPQFAEKVTISFDLGQPTNVTAKIYNLAGRFVQRLCENYPMNPGRNTLDWNGRDRDDKFCPSGMYLICVQAQGRTATKTVMVVNR